MFSDGDEAALEALITADLSAWYFHSTPLWIAVMAGASVVYFREVAKLKADGVDVDAIFAELPPE